MSSLLFIVFLASLGYVSLADVLLPTTVVQCQACCDIVAFRSEFDSFSFSTSVCKNDGCNRQVNSNNLLCSDLFSLNTNNRRGCELGRDFRFNGYTSLLTSASELRRCPSLPGEEHFLTDQLLIPHTLPAVVTPFAITRADCSDCCDELRVLADNGNNGNPDDFETASCQNTCSNNPVVPCFAQNSHNTRSGCLLAMDFLLQGRGTLDVTRGTFTCDATGGAVILGTSFPTLSPTKSPTKPTFAPTKSPNAELISAPTKLSTFQPTRSPLIPTILAVPSQPNSPQSPSIAISYAIAGAGGFGVLLSCCFVFFVLGRRSSIRQSKTEIETLERAIEELEGLRSAVANNVRPYAVGSFDPANFVAEARDLSEPGSRGISEYFSIFSAAPTSPGPIPTPQKSEFAPPGMGFHPDSLAIGSGTPKTPFRSNANNKVETIRYKIQTLSFDNGDNTVNDPGEVEMDEADLDPVPHLNPEPNKYRRYFNNIGGGGFPFGRKVMQQFKRPTIGVNTLSVAEPPSSSVVSKKGARMFSVHRISSRPSVMGSAVEEKEQVRPIPKVSI